MSLLPVPVLAEGATVALVVGSERYARERLGGAVDAAEGLAGRLEALGVDVTLVTNATRVPFERAVREFAAGVDDAHLAIIAYTGHAVRLGGSAYLVPTDVNLTSRSDLKRLPALQELVDLAARAERSLVLLDTCHASNFAGGWGERYNKAPLCPGEDEGFERPSETLLAWGSTTPTPRGPGAAVGGLLNGFAAALGGPETDVPDALRAATAGGPATALGGGEAGWPLIDADAAPAADADEGTPDAPAAGLPAGRYRISNLYRSRRLGVDADGGVGLVADGRGAGDVWELRVREDGSLSLNDVLGRGALVARGGEILLADGETRWRPVPVAGGLANEFGLRESDGAWLVGDIASGRVALESAPGGTGWLLERLADDALPDIDVATPDPGAVPDVPPVGVPNADLGAAQTVSLTVRTVPEDARVRITNIAPRYVPGIALWPNETYEIEISHPEHGRVERRITLGDEDLVLDVVMTEETPEGGGTAVAPTPDDATPAISVDDRAVVTARLEALREAVESRDLSRLARLMPPGERRDRLVSLMDAYARIDVEIRDVLGSEDGRRMSAVLRVVRLVDEFGDTVVPPPSFRDAPVYAEREGESRWSDLRWDDTGSG